jgi:hypothetical protein
MKEICIFCSAVRRIILSVGKMELDDPDYNIAMDIIDTALLQHKTLVKVDRDVDLR